MALPRYFRRNTTVIGKSLDGTYVKDSTGATRDLSTLLAAAVGAPKGVAVANTDFEAEQLAALGILDEVFNSAASAQDFRRWIQANSGFNAYWPMDDAAGNFVNLKDNAADKALVPTGVPTYKAATVLPGWTTNPDDFGADFPATASPGTIDLTAGAQALNTRLSGLSAHTIGAWVRLNDITGPHVIFARGTNASNGGLILRYRNTVGFEYIRYDAANAASLINQGADQATNTIYHVVASFDGTDMRLYVNGTLVAGPLTGKDIAAGGSNTLNVGQGDGATNKINGRIGHVTVQNTAATDDDIKRRWSVGAYSGISPYASDAP